MMESQKELKEMYINILKKEIWPDDAEMVEYCRKKCAYVVELSNGCVIALDKPSIKKDFCFGAGMYASATDEEMNRAEDMVRRARSSEDYFRAENLKSINERLEALKKAKEGELYIYTYLNYTGQNTGSKLKAYTICRLCDTPEYNPAYWARYMDLQKLEREDIESLIKGLEEARKAFIKRINTYLKRYGTSKVNAWSYVRD